MHEDRQQANVTSTGGGGGWSEDPFPFDDFAPTLAQCFSIVLAGYLSARWDLLSASDLRGVTLFASYFAMPGIICVSLADANLQDLRWTLLAGILLGKALLFGLVAAVAVALLGHRPGAAGLLAAFCVHSNDLPVGNPLISALYRDVRPDMTKYLFFLPALTLLFVAPAGAALLGARQAGGAWPAARKAAARLLKSPVLIATVAGLLLNATFRARIPGVLHQPINVVAATIPGLALSILGFNMVKKERHLLGTALVYAVPLLALKMLATPLLLHGCVRLLSGGSGHSVKHLSDFALLYGIISPSTVIFQSGVEYRKPLAAMSAALIVSSLTCFPLSYVVARITVTKVHGLAFYVPSVERVTFSVACVAIAANVLVWISFMWKKEMKKVPCCYIAYLSFTQVATCGGVMLRHLSGTSTPPQPWALYCQAAAYFGGEISGYLWLGSMAVIMILQRGRHHAAHTLFTVLVLSTNGLSALITCVICVLISYKEVQNVQFFGLPMTTFEFSQLTTSTILLGLCLVLVGCCLVLHCRRENTSTTNHQDEVVKKKCGLDNDSFYYIMPESNAEPFDKECDVPRHLFGADDEIDFYYRDVLKSEGDDRRPVFGRQWTFRYFSLLLLLWTVMATKFIANIYKLVQCKSLEVLVPLEFLQATLFVGQGLFTFLTFGIDLRTITTSAVKWYRKKRCRKQDGEPAGASQNEDITFFCSQFLNFYYERCVRSLSKDRLWKRQYYHDCFWGHQMVEWLIAERICQDDVEAEEFGQKLLIGGLLRHVRGGHAFHDAPYLYHFVTLPRGKVTEAS